MVKQITPEVNFQPRLKGTPKKPIDAKDFNQAFYYYESLFGTVERAGLTQGIRSRFAFTPKNKSKKEIAKARKKTEKLMKEIGQPVTGFKYAYIDSILDPKNNEPYAVKVRHHKKEPDTIIVNNMIMQSYDFDKNNLIQNVMGELETAFDELNANRDEDRFRIHVGEGRFINSNAITDDAVERSIPKLMEKYSDVSSNHYWGNWLTGLVRVKPTNQKTIDEISDDMLYHLEHKNEYLKKKNYEKKQKRCPFRQGGHRSGKRCILEKGHVKPHVI